MAGTNHSGVSSTLRTVDTNANGQFVSSLQLTLLRNIHTRPVVVSAEPLLIEATMFMT